VAVGEVRLLRDDLMLAESPRWHDGRLSVSDFYAHEVVALGLDGHRETIVTVPGQPSGLGWLRNGDLLIASMRDARVLRFDGRSLEVLANLSSGSPALNDMVVSPEGRAYVGGMPDLYSLLGDGSGATAVDLELPPQPLFVVDPTATDETGHWRVAAGELAFPNGAAITSDGRCLIVAETMAMRLLAFDIEADGSLTNRRVWAELGRMPDGICLDAEGCVWVAVPDPPEARGFLRVAEGGEVRDRIATDWAAVAVELGGPEGEDLFLVEARVLAVERLAEASVRGNGRVRIRKAEVPGVTFA
jgi:sugar lactone lactonase YvrE